MTNIATSIREETYLKVMCLLQENPDLTQRELADKLGMSVGKLNYCLNALIDKGFVKMANFSKSKNKFKYVYLLTPQGIAVKVALTGNEIFFQQATQRLVTLGLDDIQVAKPRIVTGEQHRFLASEQLREVGIELGAALLEQVDPNTAPALTLAAQHGSTDPVWSSPQLTRR